MIAKLKSSSKSPTALTGMADKQRIFSSSPSMLQEKQLHSADEGSSSTKGRNEYGNTNTVSRASTSTGARSRNDDNFTTSSGVSISLTAENSSRFSDAATASSTVRQSFVSSSHSDALHQKHVYVANTFGKLKFDGLSQLHGRQEHVRLLKDTLDRIIAQTKARSDVNRRRITDNSSNQLQKQQQQVPTSIDMTSVSKSSTTFFEDLHDSKTSVELSSSTSQLQQHKSNTLRTKHRREFVLIKGAPGTGKSCLAMQLETQVKRNNGFLISGKFDQHHQTKPYSAIITACRDLTQQLVELGDRQESNTSASRDIDNQKSNQKSTCSRNGTSTNVSSTTATAATTSIIIGPPGLLDAQGLGLNVIHSINKSSAANKLTRRIIKAIIGKHAWR